MCLMPRRDVFIGHPSISYIVNLFCLSPSVTTVQCVMSQQKQFNSIARETITESIFKASRTRKSSSTKLAFLKVFHAIARRPSLSESRDVTWQTLIRPIIAVKRTCQLETSEQHKHTELSAEFFIVNLIIIRMHRSTTYVDVAYCYRPSSVLCLSLCHSSELCKNGWTDRDAV